MRNFAIGAFRFLLVLCLLRGVVADAQVPAFPGADGAGAYTSGGRGGIVYHVTRLDTKLGDNGVGTLQYGINDSNYTNADGSIVARTIVFDVGGTIWLGRLTGDTEGWDNTNSISVGTNVTIAGQTAPGGITLAGGQLKINGDRAHNPTLPTANVTVRNITLAPGYGTRQTNSLSGYHDGYVYDAMDVNSNQVMVDHVSAFFATDETISSNESANNTTIQYTSMSQGQNYPQVDAEGGAYKGHAMGSLWSPASNAKTSFLHDLYANQGTRLPTIQTETKYLTKDASGNYVPAYTDFRNNVVYNWLGNAGYGSSGEPGNGNFINNYYKVGPGGDSTTGNATDPSIVQASGGTTVFSGSSSTQVYQNGGNVRNNLNGTTTTLTNSNFGSAAFQASPNSVPYYGVTETAATAYTRVLNYAGANWWNRDAIDARIFSQVANGTGKITAFDDPTNGYNSAGTYVTGSTDTEWNKLLAVRSTTNGGTGGTGAFTRSANYDTDGDGMPDAWKKAHGLNPNVADNNGDFDADGYTNVEEYLNDVAAFPAPSTLIFKTAGGNFEQYGNWNTTGTATDLRWQPSRYDQAQINAGVCTLNSVGQHAKTLTLAANAGNTAELDINGGWLKAETSVVIGNTSTSTGTLKLSGGELSTPLLTKTGASSSFVFTGGKLHADTVAFSLTNQGGTVAPGDPIGGFDATGTFAQGSGIGQTHIQGNLTMQSGAIEIQMASAASFDKVVVDGTFTAGGTLQVSLTGGYAPTTVQTFDVLDWGTQTGRFSTLQLPALTAPMGWDVSHLYSNGSLIATPYVPGDLNRDGQVTVADISALMNALVDLNGYESTHAGMTDPVQLMDVADVNGDTHIDNLDIQALIVLVANNNVVLTSGGGSGELTAVPEPAAFILLALSLPALALARRLKYQSRVAPDRNRN